MPILDRFRLDNRVVAITGGGRGMGYAMAEALAEAGARIAILELNPDLARSAEQQLTDRGHVAIGIQTDVTSMESVEAARDSVTAGLGPVDVLVNNAGGGYRPQANWSHPTQGSIPFERVSMENWRFVQDVNLTSCFICSQVFGSSMLERKSGAIVNIASMSGMVGNLGRSNASYTAAKAGVIMLTKQLAAEWAEKGIRVNAIAPGYVRTAMGAGPLDDPGIRDLIPVMTPMRRPGVPDDIQGVALFLASDASSYVTGHCLVMDGGYTLW